MSAYVVPTWVHGNSRRSSAFARFEAAMGRVLPATLRLAGPEDEVRIFTLPRMFIDDEHLVGWGLEVLLPGHQLPLATP